MFWCNFLFGGIIMTLIYYSANVANNTALSAVLALLPLSIISCYVMKDKKTMISHCEHLIPVVLITLLAILLLIAFLKITDINRYLVVTVVISLWFILNFINVKS